MTLTAVPVDAFPGLNLNPDTRQLGFGGAAECSNHDVAHPERLSPRPGTDTLVALADYRVTSIGQGYGFITAQWQGATPKVRAYLPDGTQTATMNARCGGFATIGTATDPFVYFSDVTTGLQRLEANGLSFTTAGAVTADAFLVAVSPGDNRLVLARSTAFPSRVWFSDPGDPEVYGADNFIDLDPGDGEPISNLVAWRDQLFVFKRTKFYVFFGTSIDGTGEPIFNYRPYEGGVGATGTYGETYFNTTPTAVAARDGVYFQADDGMYITTGDAPRKISGPLDAWFEDSYTATLVPTWTGDFSAASVGSDSRYVYFNPEGPTSPSFAYSLDTQQWTVFSTEILCAAPLEGGGLSEQQTLIGATAALKLMGSQFSDDDGAALTVTYRSGDDSLGSAEPKTVRKTTVRGTGAPTLSVFVDSATSDAGAAALSGLPAEATQSYSRLGTYIAHQFSGSAFTVTSLAHYVREQRLAGL